MSGDANRIVVGLGELLWDCFEDGRRPGGAPANQAFHASQLGLTGIVASRVGRDLLGDELIETLRNRGLATDLIQRDATYPTGTVAVTLSPEGEPSYEIHEPVAWDHLELGAALIEVLEKAAAVCFGTLAQRGEESRRTIRQALECAAGAVRLFDVNLRQSFYTAAILRDSLEQANMVKLNQHEASVLPELLGTDPKRPADLARWLADSYGVDFLCITRGAEGCLLFGGEESVDVPGVPTVVKDAVGAGDAFTAALLTARLEGWPLDAAGRFANGVGSLVASSEGAMPPLGCELDELRQQIRGHPSSG